MALKVLPPEVVAGLTGCMKDTISNAIVAPGGAIFGRVTPVEPPTERTSAVAAASPPYFVEPFGGGKLHLGHLQDLDLAFVVGDGSIRRAGAEPSQSRNRSHIPFNSGRAPARPAVGF